jgi:hypothetical protein
VPEAFRGQPDVAVSDRERRLCRRWGLLITLDLVAIRWVGEEERRQQDDSKDSMHPEGIPRFRSERSLHRSSKPRRSSDEETVESPLSLKFSWPCTSTIQSMAFVPNSFTAYHKVREGSTSNLLQIHSPLFKG